MVKFKRIYYGYYEISRCGRIRRVKAGMGTWPGREIHPYNPGKGSVYYVKLCKDGGNKQVKLETLIARAFR